MDIRAIRHRKGRERREGYNKDAESKGQRQQNTSVDRNVQGTKWITQMRKMYRQTEVLGGKGKKRKRKCAGRRKAAISGEKSEKSYAASCSGLQKFRTATTKRTDTKRTDYSDDRRFGIEIFIVETDRMGILLPSRNCFQKRCIRSAPGVTTRRESLRHTGRPLSFSPTGIQRKSRSRFSRWCLASDCFLNVRYLVRIHCRGRTPLHIERAII